MAYDEGLAERVRDILIDTEGVTEKKMFGGLAFMVNGNMTVAVSEERLMLRVGKEKYEEYLALPGAHEMDFTKRPMKGFLFIYEGGYEADEDLREWIGRAMEFVQTLPRK